MKLKLVLFFLSLYSISQAQIQGLTQSADGRSTVPFSGSSISLDFAKAELSFGRNSVEKNDAEVSRLIKGVSGRVRNASGISNLFAENNFLPMSSFGGFIGISRSDLKHKQKERTSVINSLDVKLSTVRTMMQARDYSFYQQLVFWANSKTPREQISLLTMINSAWNAYKISNLSEAVLVDFLPSTIRGSVTTLFEYHILYTNALSIRDEFIATVHDLEIQKQKAIAIPESVNRIKIFLFSSVDALDFKWYQGPNEDSLSNSFVNVKERGGSIGIGFNYHWKNKWFGATYSYVEANNFSSLEKREFTQNVSYTQDSLTVFEEEKFNAYAGNYGVFPANQLNLDLIIRQKIDDQGRFCLINVYSRTIMNTRNKELALDQTNAGLGFYYFKENSNFSFGTYFELNDFDNSKDDLNKPSERLNPTAFQRMNFGIVARYIPGTNFNF